MVVVTLPLLQLKHPTNKGIIVNGLSLSVGCIEFNEERNDDTDNND